MLSVHTYMLIVGMVRPVMDVTKQRSSIISDVFSNACLFLVYIFRLLFFSLSLSFFLRNFSCSFQFFCILLLLLVIALFNDISS